CHQTYNYPWTF
nr:immunoglobulin light chain junction region [Macaca mulatta]